MLKDVIWWQLKTRATKQRYEIPKKMFAIWCVEIHSDHRPNMWVDDGCLINVCHLLYMDLKHGTEKHNASLVALYMTITGKQK